MNRRGLVLIGTLAVAAVVAVAVIWYAAPLLLPSRLPPAVPSTLPLPAGTSFPLLPTKLFNGTVVYDRYFPTNATGSCQFVEGSWQATAPTTTFQGTGTGGTFRSYLLPLDGVYNGSLRFESSAPDTIRVVQTIRVDQASPCIPPVTLANWSMYNSGTMCSSGAPSPPWELRYNFSLRNRANVSMVAHLDFFLTSQNATGLRYALEGSDTFTVAASSSANFTETVYYLDCPWGTGGSANFAILDEWPAALG